MSKKTPIKIKSLKKKEIIEIDSTDIESNSTLPKLNNNQQSIKVDSNKKQSIKVDSNKKQSIKVDSNKKQSIKIDSNKKQSIKIDSNKKQSIKVDKPIINKISESIYDRPDLTYTDKLSKVQIQDLLVDYDQIKTTELQDIPPGTHLRYFQMVDSKLKFRTGGILTVKSGLPSYIILSSGKVSWSVQVADCIFFKRITIKQVKTEFNKLLEEKERDVKSLQNLIKTQSNEINRLKEILSKNNIQIK